MGFLFQLLGWSKAHLLRLMCSWKLSQFSSQDEKTVQSGMLAITEHLLEGESLNLEVAP